MAMRSVLAKALAVAFLLEGMAAIAAAAASPSKSIAAVESIYADVENAYGAISTIDSGLVTSYQGKDRRTWAKVYRKKRRELITRLARISDKDLSSSDARALTLMRNLSSLPEDPSHSLEPTGQCSDGTRKDLNYTALHDALYACFAEIGDNLEFEGARVNREAVLDDLLQQVEQPEKRKALFLSLAPLWQAINGQDRPDSPYRRLIAMAAADAAKNGSPVDTAARAVEAQPQEIEHWLEQILETWRQVSGDHQIEPWDYLRVGGEAEQILATAIPRGSLEPINQRYYHDLGADIEQLHIMYDLNPRPGKAPVAYTDWVTHGRMVHGVWRPSVLRVSANYRGGGLGALDEFVHENGHAIYYAAIRTRPAFMDTDSLFDEAFADVPAWNTYERAWQRKYLGREAPESASLRNLYSGVMMDVAWALFEIRMLRTPTADPNAVWTEITSRYLHIVPHPEWSWWAVRVQLVDSPGYMINYGLGSVLTADIRRHIRESLGPFETGDSRWYAWVSERLLRYGLGRTPAELLKDFLGRPVAPDALLNNLRRLSPQNR
jgi:hypothetical protein